MAIRKARTPKSRRRFQTIWSELSYLCSKIHFWLYKADNKRSALRYLARLRNVLQDLPENDVAIIREEALALLSELMGETRAAIRHRRREIKLMLQLHKEAAAPQYDESTRQYMLQGRDMRVLEERQAVLKALETRG